MKRVAINLDTLSLTMQKCNLKDVSAILVLSLSSFQGAIVKVFGGAKLGSNADLLLPRPCGLSTIGAGGLTVVFGMGTRGSPPPSPPNG